MAGHKIVERERTLSDYRDDFISVKQAQGIGQQQLKDYRLQLQHFIDASCNSVDYQTLNSDTLEFFAKIPDSSPARYNKPYRLVKAFFNYLWEEEVIPYNPILKNHLKAKKDDGNIKPIPEADLKQFVSVIPKDEVIGLRLYCIIMLMLDTGMRTNEIISLKNSDFNHAMQQITIRKTCSKTKQMRILPLHPSTCTYLKKWLLAKDETWQDWLFPTFEGNQLNINRLDRDFKIYSDISGIKITPYQLRHTYATIMVKNNCDVFTLKATMGHNNLSTTKRYVEIDANKIKEQHDKCNPVSAIIGGKRKRKITKPLNDTVYEPKLDIPRIDKPKQPASKSALDFLHLD